MSQANPTETLGPITTYDGTEVEISILGPRAGGGVRVDVEAVDGPTWRLDVKQMGSYETVTTWNANGELAEVAVPDWIDDVIARLQRA